MTAAGPFASAISSSRCSSSLESELTRIDIGQIAIRSDGKEFWQVARVRLRSEPPIVVPRGEHRWHTVVDHGDEIIGCAPTHRPGFSSFPKSRQWRMASGLSWRWRRAAPWRTSSALPSSLDFRYRQINAILAEPKTIAQLRDLNAAPRGFRKWCAKSRPSPTSSGPQKSGSSDGYYREN